MNVFPRNRSFPPEPRDFFPTFDTRAGDALAPFLHQGIRYAEPAAGAGDLIANLARFGADCVLATDIVPLAPGIEVADARTVRIVPEAEVIICNFPFTQSVLAPILDNLIPQRPVWMLHEASWPFTLQAVRFMETATDIVPMRRIQLKRNTKNRATYAHCWIRFEDTNNHGCRFHPLGAKQCAA